MVYRPLQGRPDGIYWYVLQTSSAAEIAFNRYWQLTRDSQLLKKKPNESEKFATLLNGAQVFFKSGAVLENLRAETLDGGIIDEMRQQEPELWPRVIRPMMSRRSAWCDFYSTPNGFDHFYDLAKFAQADQSGEWAYFHAPSTEAWWWTPQEIASARASMSEAEFAQEIMAEFRSLTQGKAYLNHGIWNQLRDSPFCPVGGLMSPHLPIVVGMDFNLSPMAWTLGQERVGDFYWFGEIYLKGSHTQEAARELVARVRHHKPGVLLAGDATAKAGQRAAAGRSDYAILKEILTDAGIDWHDATPESNPHVKDRVNIVNSKLKAADGSVHLWYHPDLCPMLGRDFDRVVWKPGASAVLDQFSNPDLTHPSDGVGYAVCALSRMWEPSPGVLRVIRR